MMLLCSVSNMFSYLYTKISGTCIEELLVFDVVKSEAEMLRDAKKVQRQQELEKKRAARQQGSGAMKLGTKKL